MRLTAAWPLPAGCRATTRATGRWFHLALSLTVSGAVSPDAVNGLAASPWPPIRSVLTRSILLDPDEPSSVGSVVPIVRPFTAAWPSTRAHGRRYRLNSRKPNLDHDGSADPPRGSGREGGGRSI